METATKDSRLEGVKREGDLDELAKIAYLSSDGGTAAAIYILICELRLMRRSLEEITGCIGYVYDHGNAFAVTEVGRR